jgi:small subunit ribosomal protein S16
MLMMRLQRVGRRNDPSYRIVVTNKRTGPKSDKHVDRLGSYNPKLNHLQLDVEKAKEWLAKGVQPSDTMHNLLVSEKVIAGQKKNVLPKKSPIIDEAALQAEAEAAAAADSATTETSETPETAAETASETTAAADAEDSSAAPTDSTDASATTDAATEATNEVAEEAATTEDTATEAANTADEEKKS